VNSRLHLRQAPPSSSLCFFSVLAPCPPPTTHFLFFSITSKLPNLQALCFALHTTVPGGYPPRQAVRQKAEKTMTTQAPDAEVLDPESPSTAPANAPGPSPAGPRCQHRYQMARAAVFGDRNLNSAFVPIISVRRSLLSSLLSPMIPPTSPTTSSPATRNLPAPKTSANSLPASSSS